MEWIFSTVSQMAAMQQISGQGISAHAFNADRSQVALSPNDKTVQILDTKTWKVLFVLDEVRLFFSLRSMPFCILTPHLALFFTQ